MSMNQNHKDGRFYDPLFMTGLKLQSLSIAATAEMPIDAHWPPVLLIDPNGGAKTILLPPEASSKDLVFFVQNTADAAETLTIEEDSSTTAIVALAQGKGAMLHCDGVTWRTLTALA